MFFSYQTDLKSIFSFGLLFLTGLSMYPAALVKKGAQDVARKLDNSLPRARFVNFHKAAGLCKQGKDVLTDIARKEQELGRLVVQEDSAFQELLKEYKNRESLLSSEERQDMANNIARQKRKFENTREDAMGDAGLYSERLQRKLMNDVRTKAIEFLEKNDYDCIFPLDSAIVDPKLDITDEFIVFLNTDYEKQHSTSPLVFAQKKEAIDSESVKS